MRKLLTWEWWADIAYGAAAGFAVGIAFAVIALLAGCAPLTTAELEQRQYERADRLVQCRDFVRTCPTVPIIVKGSAAHCGMRVKFCPDL